MSEPQFVTLLEVFDRLEAEIIKEALIAQGIPAEFFQEGVSHFIYPGGGPIGRIEICVPEDKFSEAKAWLEAYQNGQLSGAADDSPNSEGE